MGKSTEKKLFYYIKTGKLHRVRSLFKRYQPSYLTSFVDRKGRTPLHACCLLGDDAIMRLLLKNGADVQVTDCDGNTPIHFALKYALQMVRFSTFNDLIVPLLKVSSGHVLDMENNEEKTPRQYLNDLKRTYDQRRKEAEAERKQQWRKEGEDMSAKMENLEWEKKLQFEASQEDCKYSTYSQDDWTENTQESYDEWAERIMREKRQKTASSKQQKTERNRRNQEQEQKARERTRELEKEHEAYITRMSIQRQRLKLLSSLTDYEKRCQAVFCSDSTTNLKFSDLPWPSKGDTKDMIDLVVKWSELKTNEKKKFLKEQQVRWHPDKFLQKCGRRLHVDDRDQIIEQVKELSQEINALLEGEF